MKVRYTLFRHFHGILAEFELDSVTVPDTGDVLGFPESELMPGHMGGRIASFKVQFTSYEFDKVHESQVRDAGFVCGGMVGAHVYAMELK